MVKRGHLFLLFNLLSWVLVFFLPPEHAKMLIVLVFALTGWGMSVLPQPVVSLSIICYIALLGLGTFRDSLSGFSQPFVWLLVSTFVLAGALEKTGVGKRIALTLLSNAKGKTKPTVLYLLATLVMLGFLIPTAAGRSAMIMPVSLGLINVMKESPSYSLFAKNIMLGAAFTSSFISWALITGSSSSVYAVSAIDAMTGYKWTYLNWLIYHFPLMIILILFLWLFLLKQFPIIQTEVQGGYRYIREELASLGQMKRPEWNIMIIGIFTLAGWITEPYHGIQVSLIALLAALVSCIPGIGVQSWKEASKHISWDVIILFGAGFALADTLQRNGTAAWLAARVTDSLPGLSPFAAALLMISVILVFRLGFANMLAITAIFLPITISLAERWDIEPVWLVQIVIISCSLGYFLPFQSPSNLITYSYGFYDERDFFRTGAVVSFMVAAVVLFSAFFYWPLLGLSAKPGID